MMKRIPDVPNAMTPLMTIPVLLIGERPDGA